MYSFVKGYIQIGYEEGVTADRLQRVFRLFSTGLSGSGDGNAINIVPAEGHPAEPTDEPGRIVEIFLSLPLLNLII